MSPRTAAEETCRLVESAGRRAIPVRETQWMSIIFGSWFPGVSGEFDKVDILVNNAAHQRTHQQIKQFSSEQFDHTFRTNVYAMFYLCQEVLPRMQPGSTIINVASIQVYDPSPELLAYASTKGAIITFTNALFCHGH